jgi:hypothetical protein
MARRSRQLGGGAARLEYKLLLQGGLQLLSCVVDELEGAIQAQLASSQRAEVAWESEAGGRHRRRRGGGAVARGRCCPCRL